MFEILIKHLLALKGVAKSLPYQFNLSQFLLDYIQFSLEERGLTRSHPTIISEDRLKISQDGSGDFLIQEVVDGIVLEKPLYQTQQGVVINFNLGPWIFNL